VNSIRGARQTEFWWRHTICATAALFVAVATTLGSPGAAGEPAPWTPEVRIGEQVPPVQAEFLPTTSNGLNTTTEEKRPSASKSPATKVGGGTPVSEGASAMPAPTVLAAPASSSTRDVAGAASPGTASTNTQGSNPGANPEARPDPATPRRSGSTLADKYCEVVVEPALAAKLAKERQEAKKIQTEIEAKLNELKLAIDEQEKWLKLRKDFQNTATDNLVTVYSQMDAEAAAQRLTAVGDHIASAILIKLPPKSASAILGEMPSDVAGRLTAFMAGSAELKTQAPTPERGATQ
jgi:flagellar motility protein MotE (MotC chaperone)